MKSVSPSFHSLVCRSSVRGVQATVKFATAAPDGVNRSSGSPVRFPISVMGGSPAMTTSSCTADDGWCDARPPDAPGSVLVRPDDLGPEDRLVQRELTVELLYDRRLGGQVDDGVDAFGLL